ncbi:lysophospholipid acyltransferase family protein [Nocardioides sp. BP30]|uniref:lysophospholipid acyltransferase family protein n=1 Tax=Nocardioides sp. BP30 TaxID=3036374 RepID=UPI002469269F|nr:lysophospholipid acyltransferase family protein [Nocardioides sp. BP30]WGL53662.1 lysophospholipid acyltransferase family protein [Nocardioides sp. BP30]
MGKYRKLQGERGWAWTAAVGILKPLLLATTKQDWTGGDKIPARGGAIIALNHVSHVDPLTAAHLVWDYGRESRYLAKSSLFKNAQLGRFLRAAGQIPVDRSAGADAFKEAVAAVNAGEVVVVYIEGSITKDPAGWPMVPKSGAARIALATGAPVIPVGQWGAQALLPAYSRRPHLVGRKTITMRVGDPVELDDLREQRPTAAAVRQATDRIMAAIVDLVEEIRGEEAPDERFDPRKHGLNSTGNPNLHKKAAQ